MTTWDAVWLNDEVDLLVWRLTVLRDVVDRFLVVEGDRTFTGRMKESAFLAHKARIDALGLDVEHVLVPLDQEAATAWDRENQQRRGLARALDRLAAEGDLLLVSDVDEVPRPELVAWLKDSLDHPVRLHMQHMNYYANWAQPTPWENSAWAYRHGQAVDHRMLWVHLGDTHQNFAGYVEEFIPDAGWHLSFLGGVDAIRAKWAAYSHQEYNTEVDRAPGHLERCFRYGVHFQGRILLRKIPRTETHPVLLKLERVREDFFRFEAPPPVLARRAYRGWTWLRRMLPLPHRLRVAIDSHRVLYLLISPLLLLVDMALAGIRRVRSRRPLYESRRWEPGQEQAECEGLTGQGPVAS
jgi:beta-1,4-mannosyl-glycoprotein beta-1,4-N-acetylglucosaminyltransferase